jgi:hypothetical protein
VPPPSTNFDLLEAGTMPAPSPSYASRAQRAAPTPSSYAPLDHDRTRGSSPSSAWQDLGRSATPTPPYAPYPLALPQPLHGQQPYLRPGVPRPRGASEHLTTTQVIERPVSAWIVASVAIAVVVAAAFAIVAVTRASSDAAPGVPPVVRMSPTPGPTVSPIDPAAPAAPAAAPAVR